MVELQRCSRFGLWFMVYIATFNNISVISWRSILLVEETGVPGENHRQTLSHNVVSSTPHNEQGSNNLVMIGTDCTGSCIYNLTTIRS